MDAHTRTLQQELNERWLALEDIEVKELVVMTLRCLSRDADETGYEGLPNYEAAIKRMDAEIEEKYGRKE